MNIIKQNCLQIFVIMVIDACCQNYNLNSNKLIIVIITML